MPASRGLLVLIRGHFGAFRKSQRKTLCDLTSGLLRGGKVGLAQIARGMVARTTVRRQRAVTAISSSKRWTPLRGLTPYRGADKVPRSVCGLTPCVAVQ